MQNMEESKPQTAKNLGIIVRGNIPINQNKIKPLQSQNQTT